MTQNVKYQILALELVNMLTCLSSIQRNGIQSQVSGQCVTKWIPTAKCSTGQKLGGGDLSSLVNQLIKPCEAFSEGDQGTAYVRNNSQGSVSRFCKADLLMEYLETNEYLAFLDPGPRHSLRLHDGGEPIEMRMVRRKSSPTYYCEEHITGVPL